MGKLNLPPPKKKKIIEMTRIETSTHGLPVKFDWIGLDMEN